MNNNIYKVRLSREEVFYRGYTKNEELTQPEPTDSRTADTGTQPAIPPKHPTAITPRREHNSVTTF
jgi:hypothetical protein